MGQIHLSDAGTTRHAVVGGTRLFVYFNQLLCVGDVVLKQNVVEYRVPPPKEPTVRRRVWWEGGELIDCLLQIHPTTHTMCHSFGQ